MRRTLTKTVEQKVELDIPDHFVDDETLRGRIVDYLLEHSGYSKTRKDGVYWPRYVIAFESSADLVKSSVTALEEAYSTADKIMAL